MKKRVTLSLNILGHKLIVNSNESEDHLKSVAVYLNNKIEEVKEKTKTASTLDLALLAALNITGEVIKSKELLEGMGKKHEELAGLIDKRLV